MPRARMTQRRNLFKKFTRLASADVCVCLRRTRLCSGYRVCLRRTRSRVRARRKHMFSFLFLRRKSFYVQGSISVFLSIICYKSFFFQKTLCTYRLWASNEQESKNNEQNLLRCIFDGNNFFSLIKCYCSVFFSWIILCILLLYKCKVHRINKMVK